MTHASLFSGIGGFDLAAEWMGWDNLFWCEKDQFCQRVLRHHFIDSYEYNDIYTADFTLFTGRVDVLTGGFPCQPFSIAGKRAGRNDDRWLWGEMYRAIKTIRPRYVVAENVFGLLNQGEGLAFEQVCSDLEAVGYEVQSFVIPACSVGAPHKRDRVWIVAYTDTERDFRRSDALQQGDTGGEKTIVNGKEPNATDTPNAGIESMYGRGQNEIYANGAIADPRLFGQKERQKLSVGVEQLCEKSVAPYPKSTRRNIGKIRQGKRQLRRDNSVDVQIPNWSKFPTVSPVHNGDDGLSDRLVGITFPCWRREAIKACGNAIVPQIALEIFRVIELCK